MIRNAPAQLRGAVPQLQAGQSAGSTAVCQLLHPVYFSDTTDPAQGHRPFASGGNVRS